MSSTRRRQPSTARPGEKGGKISNKLANQFQIPVLFCALCLMIYSRSAVSTVLLVVAWFFVVSRCAHALVHVTMNHAPHRFSLFLVGVLSVWLMIGLLATSLAEI